MRQKLPYRGGCGKEEGGDVVSLKTCKSCICQVLQCRLPEESLGAAQERMQATNDEALLYSTTLAKVDCPICFLPIPVRLL